MLTKIKILFLLLLTLFPFLQSYALTRFPQGTCTLEGLLVKATNEVNWYFIVNSGTNSETRFKLKTFLPTGLISENGQFVESVLDIPHETFSLYGEAELKKVVHFINPYTDPKHYDLDSEVRQACALNRYPNSIKSQKRTKSH